MASKSRSNQQLRDGTALFTKFPEFRVEAPTLLSTYLSFPVSIKSSMPKPNKGSKGPKTSKDPTSSSAAAATAPPPAWPVFKPPLPVVDLVPELHPSNPNIALLPSFFPRSLCRDYVSFLKTLPLQTTPGRPKRGEAVRVNDRYQIDDPAFARRLWEETGLRETLLDEGGGAEHLKHLW